MTTQPPKIIYLIQEDVCEWLWCEDPAPGADMDPKDATKYIKVSDLEALFEKWNKKYSEYGVSFFEKDLKQLLGKDTE